jgi:hypothetical protein
VWLHWQAKDISFDTALGYRTYYLLTAGVAATIAEIQASTHPGRSVPTAILPAGATAPAFVTVPWTQTADLTSWYLRTVPVNLVKCVFPAAVIGRRW